MYCIHELISSVSFTARGEPLVAESADTTTATARGNPLAGMNTVEPPYELNVLYRPLMAR